MRSVGGRRQKQGVQQRFVMRIVKRNRLDPATCGRGGRQVLGQIGSQNSFPQKPEAPRDEATSGRRRRRTAAVMTSAATAM